MYRDMNAKKVKKEKMYAMIIILGAFAFLLSWQIVHESKVSKGMRHYYEEKMECAESLHK